MFLSYFQKFGVEDSIAVEVNFIISYENLKKRLKDLKAESTPSASENKTPLQVSYFININSFNN